MTKSNLLNKDVIKKDILRVYDQCKDINSVLYTQHGKYCVASTLKYFNLNSWIDLMSLLGFKSPRNITKQDIIYDIQKVAQEHGTEHGLSNTIYSLYGKYSPTTVNKKFGSWHSALIKSGVSILPSRKPSYSIEHLINCIDHFVDQYGYVPAAHHLDRCKDKFPCSTTYYTHFNDNWQNIMLKCGYKYYGMRFKGYDLRWYDSIREKHIADLLYLNKVQYIAHKKVCKIRKWRCDFYLPQYDLWIEYDGLGNKRNDAKTYNMKIQYYLDNKYKLIILKPKDNFINILSEYILLDKACDIRLYQSENQRSFVKKDN